MSKTGEGDQLPPPWFNEDGNTIIVNEDSKLRASNQPSIEDLMKKLDKFKAENKKLRAKSKKGMTHSSSSEDDNSEEEVSMKGRKGRKHDKPSYNSMSFNYNTMSSSTAYTSVPIGKALCFNGVNYNQWKHSLQEVDKCSSAKN
jgi:hypothetical protein